MPKKRPSRNRKDKPQTLTIFSRINSTAIRQLDAIAGEMDPQPTRAQLIDRAVREFVQRRRAAG